MSKELKQTLKKAKKNNAALKEDLKKEDKAITSMSVSWKRRSCTYIALERLKFNPFWDENEVYGVIAQVEQGEKLEHMIKSFRRPANDLRVLIFELALTGRLTKLPVDF